MNNAVIPSGALPDDAAWLLIAQLSSGKTQLQIALELDCSRTAVNLLVNGKYPGGTSEMARRINDRYAVVDCPFLGEQIKLHACQAFAHMKPPTQNPHRMELWRACQGCHIKPGAPKAVPNTGKPRRKRPTRKPPGETQ